MTLDRAAIEKVQVSQLNRAGLRIDRNAQLLICQTYTLILPLPIKKSVRQSDPMETLFLIISTDSPI